MSIELTLRIESGSSGTTEAFGEQLGKSLKGGEVIELRSDLGGGKTTLTRGIVRGFGSDAVVSSPSFMIERQYPAGERVVHHFDLYRLQNPGLVGDMLSESLAEPEGVVIVEWAQTAHHLLPDERIIIILSKTADERRQLDIQVPPQLRYIIEALEDNHGTNYTN